MGMMVLLGLLVFGLCGVGILVASRASKERLPYDEERVKALTALAERGKDARIASGAPTGDSSVHLDEAGRKKIAVIKVIRDATGLSLKEAKQLADQAGGIAILDGVPRDRAEQVKAALEAAGARARVTSGEVHGVRGRAGPSRCPYCHEDARDGAIVACAGCVARHHEACWDEHSQCASCGNPERFAGIEHTGGRETRSEPVKE
jgi:large subunit ribosomal protein L7/L12